MKNQHWLLIAITALLLNGCSQKNATEKNTITVVATTGMIYDAILNIAGDKIKTEVLMGPGVDPHLYKATQGDVKKLTQADAIFYNGLHLEGKMGEVLEQLQRTRRVVAVAESLPDSLVIRSEAFQNSADPHIWFDVSRWKYAVTAIGQAIIQYDTANRGYYQKNLETYLDQLDSLDQFVQRRIEEIPPGQRILVTAHDAFGYF